MVFIEQLRSVFREWEARYRAEIGQATEPDADTRVSLMRHGVAFLVLDGPTPRTLERVRVFLNDQLPGTGAPIRVSFWGGLHHGAGVHVRDLRDFDFADAWLMDGFDLVCATQDRWTWKEIGQFLAAVRDDFAHDGIKARVWILDVHSREVCLGCLVLDADLGAFRLARAILNAKYLTRI